MPRTHYAREERFGGFLEDYEVGDVFHHWPGKTVTESEDHLFCLMTMAASPLHVDRTFATKESEFGRNVVVGTFVYSLLLGMSVPDISGRAIANLGLSELRHVAPLFHGDTLYGRTEYSRRGPRPVGSAKDSQGANGRIQPGRRDGLHIRPVGPASLPSRRRRVRRADASQHGRRGAGGGAAFPNEGGSP
jgi:acyl dehydratase